MVSLMQKCGKAITSPSTISIEYLAVGGQLFLKQIADNQESIYKYLTQSNIANPIEHFFLNKKPSSKKSIIDGKQKSRFINLVKNLAIQLQEATSADCSLYYDWANDPETRKQSLSSCLLYTSPSPRDRG